MSHAVEIARQARIVRRLFGVVFIGLLIGLVFAISGPRPNAPTGDIAINWRANVRALSALKAALHDPSSFSLMQAYQTDDGMLCVTYRARNGFGALTASRAMIGRGIARVNPFDEDFEQEWNDYCASRPSRDLSVLGYLSWLL